MRNALARWLAALHRRVAGTPPPDVQEQTDHANFIQAARAHVAQCNAAAQRVIDEAHVEAVRIVAEPAAKAAVLEQKCDALRYEAQQLEAKVAATRRVLDDLRGALNPSTKGQPT